jgi:phage shock protein E
MISFIKRFLASGAQVDFKELMKAGATIVDVRNKNEYDSGHISGSLNIPLNVFGVNLSKFDKEKPVITCCASGTRSLIAKNILLSNGFKKAYNGGGWKHLNKIIS